MSKTSALSRRTVLRGFAGAPLALPLLEAMAPFRSGAQAATAAPIAQRLIIQFVPLGTVRERWFPTGTGENFVIAPNSCLASMEPHKRDILVMKGVDMKSTRRTSADHRMGMVNLLTGNGANGSLFSEGASVDQVLGQRLGKNTKFRTLQFGVGVTHLGETFSAMSSAGPKQPLFPENDPVKIFDRVFSGVGSGTVSNPGGDLRRAQRHSVLDGVTASYQSLRGRLGAEDRVKIDQHLQAISELEKQIDATVSTTCSVPPAPSPVPKAGAYPPQIPTGDLQEKLLVLALKCDLTRVATLQWANASSFYNPIPAQVSGAHHTLTHAMDSDPTARDGVTKISAWYTSRFAGLIQRLKDENLFSSTLLLQVTELAQGDVHSVVDMPFLLAGGGGYFRTGRFVTYAPSQPHNNLLVSIMNAMGQPDTTFGESAFCSGPLPGLT
jgi:hypothetical protein